MNQRAIKLIRILDTETVVLDFSYGVCKNSSEISFETTSFTEFGLFVFVHIVDTVMIEINALI